jgi:hypothetical protein
MVKQTCLRCRPFSQCCHFSALFFFLYGESENVGRLLFLHGDIPKMEGSETKMSTLISRQRISRLSCLDGNSEVEKMLP